MGKRPHVPHPLDAAELQYHVELWSKDGNTLEKCVVAAARITMARAMLPLAVEDYPQSRIIIRQGAMVIADSGRAGTG